MNEPQVGRYRSIPLHAAASENLPDQNSAKNKDLQHDAAVQVDAAAPEVAVQNIGAPVPDDYMISVDQVREHLKKKGLRKSKDTIQRWCRDGDLDCRKQGLLNRFFTTEASLKAIEKKLLPDMIADQNGVMQVHEAAPNENQNRMQVQAAEDHKHSEDLQSLAGENAAARTRTQVNEPVDAAARTSTQLEGNVVAEIAELRARVSGLASQLEQSQQMSKFLQEEIVSARGQRGDVVKIAEQMLGTLETMAVGGRLEKPKSYQSQPSEPVRYQPTDPGANEV